MTTFYWVRHGPTHQKNFTGWRDVPADLSDTDAIARLERYLPQDAIVISSDLLRARTTADAIQGQRQRLGHDANLREFHFGDWDGLHFSEVSEQHPELSRAYWERPGDVAPPNGESWNQAAARINTTVDHLIKTFPGQNIVAVAHFGAILTQVQRGLGVTAYESLAHKIDPLSVTRVALGDRPVVDPINHAP
ncbi:histidine phosphatase family protein [Shimia ponticola]|uniref:histidine phosphatase family protein n=1 Tax=Shimia ponticola TaxID=2582893 RepID=UPI0011BF591B|nr:histidine phosphatase family protein [Shimia ponticola]